MSTGLHTKISIQIDGNEVEVKEIGETVSSVTIGSGSDAAICIDVPGVDSMHAFLSFEGGIPMLGDLAGQITVNGAPLDPNQPLKSGDAIQISNVTLVLDITDLRAEDATDPGIHPVAEVTAPVPQEYFEYEEEVSEEYEPEFGLDGLVESIQENSVDSGKAKTKLAKKN